MRGKYPLKLAVGAAVITLLAAGCSGDGDDTEAPKVSDAAISIDGTQPENPLVPAGTTETGGGQVIDALFSGLTDYETENGKLKLVHAESITPDDSSTVYTIKLKPGWTWHDGTPVKAQDYVDAWNDAAYSPNGLANGTFMSDIAGYDQVYTEDPDGAEGPQKAPKPPAEKMTGLEVVSDTEFKVTLAAPSNLWPLKTGYSAFMPLPPAYFSNKESFGKNPIGNGPFKLVSFTENDSIKVTRFDDYKGDKPKIKDVTFKFYQDDTASYADVQSGVLDFLQQVPSANLVGEKYKADFGDRAVSNEAATTEFLGLPHYRKEYQNPKFRQAISVAINRDQITERIFSKTREPAHEWSNPNVDGFTKDTCREFCTYDPAKAKSLLQEAGVTVNPDGSFVSNGVTVKQMTIQYNADASHKDWVDATCNSIKEATGIACAGKPIPTFGESRTIIDERKATGMFRNGWQADYPINENFMNPLLRTGASSNDGAFSDAAFDAKLKEADGTKDLEAAKALYTEAEKMLADLMPTIPLWHRTQQSVWSEKLKGPLPIDIFGELVLTEVEASES
jgi:oligopeptide transport system substrate-binding protein